MQSTVPHSHTPSAVVKTAASKGLRIFGAVALMQMLVYAITCFGLLAFDWLRMDRLYHLGSSYLDQLAARQTDLDVMASALFGALLFCIVLLWTGWLIGKKIEAKPKFAIGWGSLATLPASMVGVVATVQIFRFFEVEPPRIYFWEYAGFLGLLSFLFYLPTIPAGLFATWLTRWWILRSAQPEDFGYLILQR
jgi:hypothetical protein